MYASLDKELPGGRTQENVSLHIDQQLVKLHLCIRL